MGIIDGINAVDLQFVAVVIGSWILFKFYKIEAKMK
jgi:hypothetical protein